MFPQKNFENVLSKCRGLLSSSKCLDQVIDFTDPVESEKGNWLKGTCLWLTLLWAITKKKNQISQFVCRHWSILGRRRQFFIFEVWKISRSGVPSRSYLEYINHLFPMDPFSTPSKYQKSSRFSNVFRW